MNAKKGLVGIIALIIVGFLTANLVFAQGWGQRRGFKGQNGPGYAMMQEMSEARVDVLAELGKTTAEEVKAKLEYKPVWAVIDELGVDYKVYKEKMQTKRIAAIDKAVADGKITKTQADFMKERMANNNGFGPRMGGKGFKGGMRGGCGNMW